jgi:[acyl-carrier-protein] S-malonyltransferase
MFDRLEAVVPPIGAAARARAAALCGDPTDFSTNRAIQVGVTAAALGWLELLREHDLVSTASAGLSLGEFAHLVDIGALAAGDSLALVAKRGELYDGGPPGCMAAIFPAPWEALAPLVERTAAAHGGADALAPAVFTSPTQTVVAGSRPAVDELVEVADEELYARGVVIEDRIPMHTPRFAPVARRFRPVLEAARWAASARAAYWPNVTATRTTATRAAVVDHLTRHVDQPVRWHATVDALVAAHPDAVFVETGPGTVLRDLMVRRWHPDRDVFALDAPGTPLTEMSGHVRRTLDAIARARDGRAQPHSHAHGPAVGSAHVR